MITKANCLVLVLQFFTGLLSFRESLFPTIIRQRCRSSVGEFPLGISPSGFRCFKIETVFLHQHRVTEFDVNFSKSRKGIQTQIWDPGLPNFDCANGGFQLRPYHINRSRILFVLAIKNSILSLPKASISFSDGDGLLFLRSAISSSPFVYSGFGDVLLGLKIGDLNYGVDDEPVTIPQSGCAYAAFVKRFSIVGIPSNLKKQNLRAPVEHMPRQWRLVNSDVGRIMEGNNFKLILQTGEVMNLVIQRGPGPFAERLITVLVYIAICRGILINRAGYEDVSACGRHLQKTSDDHFHLEQSLWQSPWGILSSIHWWYSKHSLWQYRWFRSQQRLPNEHRTFLPESSSILISPRRQDSESSLTTLDLHSRVKVMPKAFWSLSSKLIANKKYVEKGHNRLHLLAYKTTEKIAWLLSTPSSKLYQFPIFAYNDCFGKFLYFVNTL